MSFSQELKNAATLAGFRYAEVPIEYRVRGGEVKLHAVRAGAGNLAQLVGHRFRRPIERCVTTVIDLREPATVAQSEEA
jgi:hypothetical protein